MINRLKQIWRDHKAMSLIRKGNGDVQLVLTVGQYGSGWDCYIYQRHQPLSMRSPYTNA